jgi:translation initiation factor RLI1
LSNHLINLDYYKCRPDLCNKGVCAAASVCPLKLIIQEEPFDYPMAYPFVCKGCSKCVSACPLEAINLS